MKVMQWLLLCTLTVAMGLGAAETPSGDLARNFENTKRLLEISSGAQRVMQSGNERALAARNEALQNYAEAEQARDDGDDAKATALLNKAKMTMFTAVRLAGSGQAGTDKKKADYDARNATILALLDAHKRVYAEDEGKNAAELAVEQEVEGLLEKADASYTAGEYVAGKAVLDDAFVKLQASMERMLGGETRTNTVEFKNDEDEYAYYSMKVGSQMTAITKAAQSVVGTRKEKGVKIFIDKLTAGLEDAEALADQGEHRRAVRILKPLFMQAPYRLMSLLK